MNSIMNMVQDGLGSAGVADLSQHLGVDPATAQSALTAAIPVLIGAMSSAGGQATGAPMGTGGSAGGGLLGSLFGGRHADMSQQVSQSSGLNIHQAEKALLLLAPIVMAQLARNRGTAPATSAAAQPTAAADTGSGGLIGAVERMFHKDG